MKPRVQKGRINLKKYIILTVFALFILSYVYSQNAKADNEGLISGPPDMPYSAIVAPENTGVMPEVFEAPRDMAPIPEVNIPNFVPSFPSEQNNNPFRSPKFFDKVEDFDTFRNLDRIDVPKKIDDFYNYDFDKKDLPEIINPKEPIQCIKTPAVTEKLFVLLGESIDPKFPHTKKPLSDIWSTIDGENWKKEAESTIMGAKFMSALVKTPDNTVYIFGGLYNTKNEFDTTIYKTKDMKNFDFVGYLPSNYKGEARRNIVVYYQDKFWLLNGSGIEGIWTSTDGANWTEVVKEAPWKNDPNYIYTHSALALKNQILFFSSIPEVPWTPYTYTSSDGKDWVQYNPYKQGTPIGWIVPYSPFIFKDMIISFPRHDSNHQGYALENEKSSEYRMWYTSLVDKINPDQTNWYDIVLNSWYPTKIFEPISLEKTHSEELAETFISFKDKLYSIGGAVGGWDSGERWRQTDGKTKTTGKVWVSENARSWKEAIQKGVAYPGPADRSMAVATTLPAQSLGFSSLSAPDLEVTTFKGYASIAGPNAQNVDIGEWQLSANSKDKDTTFEGEIKISSIDLYGTAVKPNSSSLANLRNIRVYSGTNLLAVMPGFEHPFYRNPCDPVTDCGTVIQKTIYFDKNLILKQDEKVMIKIVADLVNAPQNFTIDISAFTYNEVNNGKPCSVYVTDPNDNLRFFPGKTINIAPPVLKNDPSMPINSKKSMSF